jgi:hypothetical protein
MDALNYHLIGKLRDDEEFQNEVQDINILIFSTSRRLNEWRGW